MTKMFRLFTLSVAALCCSYAQLPAGQAPPDVDSALRARVQKFYQAMVDKKYRIADGFVAEESKDAFYAIEKPNYQDYAIKAISYSPGFKEAKVSVVVSTEFVMPGHGPIPAKRTTNTTWKVIDGQWFLVLTTAFQNTPFGSWKPSGGGASGIAPSGPTLFNADKTELRFSRSGEQQIKLTSRMGAPLTLSVDDLAMPGLTASLDKDSLPPGGTVTLTVRWAGKPEKPEAAIVVRSKPISGAMTIRVLFDNAAPGK